MKKITLVLLVLLSSQLMGYQVAASTVNAMNTGVSYAQIEMKTTHGNTDNCSSGAASNTLIMPLTDATKSMYAALLSASVTGMTVRVLYENCISDLPAIFRVDLLP